MRISDWSSDVCSSDLLAEGRCPRPRAAARPAARSQPGRHHRKLHRGLPVSGPAARPLVAADWGISSFRAYLLAAEGHIRERHESTGGILRRAEEHTSELQSLMRLSHPVCCLKQTNT